ncbi:MAG: HIRAN domain-containing protein [Deltaproteobacteria bacterium]|nr:HIRAN domain-containing protein [Deltaproteobacteria bacterium]
MTDARGLFVIWREPTPDGHRHVVGRLWQSRGLYHFAYAGDLAQARARGFQPFVELPSESTTYESAYLFPTFSQRIPVPARPDFRRLMDRWGVEHPDDKLEVLAKSGGLQATDRVELAPWRDPDGLLDEPMEFRVAGARHRDAAPELPVGAAVTLCLEPENPVDPHAVRVESADGVAAGYVPRQFAQLVSRALLDGTPLVTTVVRTFLEPGSEHARAVVRVAPLAPRPRA